MLNDESIQAIMSEYSEAGNSRVYYFYGVMQASLGTRMLLGSLAGFTDKYFVIGFTSSKLILVKISMTGKPADSKEIPLSEIVSFKTGNWLFGIGKKMNIVLSDNTKLKLKVNNHVAGIKKQKENIEEVCKLYANQ